MVLMGFLKILQKQFQNLCLNTFSWSSDTIHVIHNTWIKNLQTYDEFPRLDKQRTPIECKIVEIQIGNNPSHTITIIQFPTQLVVAQTIHRSQGLTLDCLTFDMTGVTKHGLRYTTLSRVFSKKNCIYFLCYW
jgi:hypothetical protein